MHPLLMHCVYHCCALVQSWLVAHKAVQLRHFWQYGYSITFHNTAEEPLQLLKKAWTVRDMTGVPRSANHADRLSSIMLSCGDPGSHTPWFQGGPVHSLSHRLCDYRHIVQGRAGTRRPAACVACSPSFSLQAASPAGWPSHSAASRWVPGAVAAPLCRPASPTGICTVDAHMRLPVLKLTLSPCMQRPHLPRVGLTVASMAAAFVNAGQHAGMLCIQRLGVWATPQGTGESLLRMNPMS